MTTEPEPQLPPDVRASMIDTTPAPQDEPEASTSEPPFEPRVDLGDGDYAILKDPEELTAKDIRQALRGLEGGSDFEFAAILAVNVVTELAATTRAGVPILPPTAQRPNTLDAMKPKQYLKLMATIVRTYQPAILPDMGQSDDPASPTGA